MPSFLLLNLAPCDSQTSSISIIFFFETSFNRSLLKALKPNACVKKMAIVFLFILFLILSKFAPKFSKLISTKTGVKPLYNIDVTSDTHVRLGTIISPLL